MLVATHVDATRATKSQQGEWICPDATKTFETIAKIFSHIPKLHPSPVIMDCNAPNSFGFKQLKGILSNMKQDCSQVLIQVYFLNVPADFLFYFYFLVEYWELDWSVGPYAFLVVASAQGLRALSGVN